MHDNPKVTIILPVYNVDKFLPDCLDSILNQSYKNLDIISIDDGSSDSSLNILKEYSQKDKRIRVITQLNQGVSSARNNGLSQRGKGKYVFFMDSDDILEKYMIDKLVTLSEKYGLDVVRFDAQNFIDGMDIKKSGNKENIFTIRQIRKEFSIYERDIFLKKSWYYALNTVWVYFIKLEILEKNDKLSFEEGILHEDTLFVPLLMYRTKKVGYLKKVLYFRRIRPFSIMTTPQKNDEHFYSIVYVLKKLDILSNKLNPNERVYKKYIETYKAKAFLLLNQYSSENNKTDHKLKVDLGIKIPLFQKFLFIRRKFFKKGLK